MLSAKEIGERISICHSGKITMDESTYKSLRVRARFVHIVYGEFFAIPKNLLKGKRLKQDAIKDLTGHVFGSLTVIAFSHTDGNSAFWKCSCLCGKEMVANSHSLLRGQKSCGCSNQCDFVGVRFGKIVVTERISGNGIVYWKYHCDCGVDKMATTHDIQVIKSCGCGHRNYSVVNNRYGKLVVIEFSHISECKHAMWTCICDCGNTITVSSHSLTSGHTRSCGCNTVEFREDTSIERYGTKNPVQNRDIGLKLARARNESMVLKHWKTGEDLVCQASWEVKVVEYLNKNKIDFRWQPRVFKMLDGKTYRPDLYLIGKKTWIEIKGYFWGNSRNKWDWFHAEHPNSELWNKARLKELGIL